METQEEIILHTNYDKVANKLAKKNKINITISDDPLDRNTHNDSIRYKDQSGKQEEFLNVVYLGSEMYLWGSNTARDLKKIIFKGKEFALPENFVFNLLDITKIGKFGIYSQEFMTINNIKIDHPIAIYHDKTLEIYLSCLNSFSENKEKLFESILEWGVKQYKPTLPQEVKSTKEDEEKIIRTELGRMLSTDRTGEKTNLVSEKGSLERSISENLKYIKEYKSKIEQISKDISDIDKPIDLNKEIESQLRLLKENDVVRDIKVVNGKFYVFTNKVELELDNYLYDLGTYEIVLDLSKRNYIDKVRIFNELNQTTHTTRQHPHVKEEGACCLGNIGEKIQKMLRSRQIAETIIVLIAYLHTYYPESSFIKILEFMEQIGTSRKPISGTGRRKKAGVKPRPEHNSQDEDRNHDEDN